ncbi:MAG: uracil-DNA glycosylase, partial [Planctomycetota bacterium]
FIGEAPGYSEDDQGRPFVGKAGSLLTGMIEKGMKRPRSSVYICNAVKCRSPRNRDPEETEILSCAPYLQEQLTVIRPKLIITLGRVAGQIMTGERLSMRSLRGRFFDFRGIPLLPTYHPEQLLKVREREGGTTREDKETWQDLQKAMKFLKEN